MDQTQFPTIDQRAFVKELCENGAAFGLDLSPQTVAAIHEYAQAAPCYADRVESHGFMLNRRHRAEAVLRKPILLAQYFNTAAECPDIRRLVNDPMLQAIAANI